MGKEAQTLTVFVLHNATGIIYASLGVYSDLFRWKWPKKAKIQFFVLSAPL